MKYSFTLALAAASFFSLTQGWQSALAQQAEYLPGQNQAAADQSQNLAASSAKSTGALSPYEMQEKAIQKGLADNAAQPEKMASYSPDTGPIWSSAPKAASTSKMRGVVSAAGMMLRKTASVALPTAGVVLLSAAINRGAMMSLNRRPGFGGSPFGGNNFNQQGYNQMNGFPNGATSNYPVGAFNNYSYPYYTGH